MDIVFFSLCPTNWIKKICDIMPFPFGKTLLFTLHYGQGCYFNFWLKKIIHQEFGQCLKIGNYWDIEISQLLK